MAISAELLSILVCPQCKGEIEPTAGGDWLICSDCRLKYPVRGDIPVLLVEESERIGD